MFNVVNSIVAYSTLGMNQPAIRCNNAKEYCYWTMWAANLFNAVFIKPEHSGCAFIYACIYASRNLFYCCCCNFTLIDKTSSGNGQRHIYALEHQLYYYYNNFRGYYHINNYGWRTNCHMWKQCAKHGKFLGATSLLNADISVWNNGRPLIVKFKTC